MKSMRLVRYRPEHEKAILVLHRDAMVGLMTGVSQDDDEADLRAVVQSCLHSGEFLVGLLSREVIAMGGFQRLSDNSAELCRMRIHRDFQGQGYGGQLLKELERIAFQSGVRIFCFETAKARPLTLEFYRKHGYQETGTGFYGEVETVHFSKVLDEKVLAGKGHKQY